MDTGGGVNLPHAALNNSLLVSPCQVDQEKRRRKTNTGPITPNKTRKNRSTPMTIRLHKPIPSAQCSAGIRHIRC
jgi:hypothetical protein